MKSQCTQTVRNLRMLALVCTALLVHMLSLPAHAKPTDHTLTLQTIQKLAIDQDPWLANSQYKQQQFQARGLAKAQLPNPSLQLKLANLPLDSLDFSKSP